MTLSKQWEEIFERKNIKKDEVPLIVDGLQDWALRAYFGEKNKNKIWYTSEVTKESVLDRFFKNTAPISPENLLNVWLEIPRLQEALESFESKIKQEVVPEENDGTTYISGDITLKEIAKNLGGITGTMVNKLFQSGVDKMKILTNGIHPDEIESNDWYKLEEKVEQAVTSTSLRYAILLFGSSGHEDFLNTLIAESIITEKEALLVSDDEKQGLDILRNEYPIERSAIILAADYNEEESLFTTFQSAVSKLLFPRRKKASGIE